MGTTDTDRLLTPSHRLELGGRPLDAGADGELGAAFVGAVVERASLRVDTAELVFRDPHLRLSSHPLLQAGTSVRLFLDPFLDHADPHAPRPVFEGEITGGELRVGVDRPPLWKVRAFHRLHRLAREPRTRAFPSGPLIARVAGIAQSYGWTASAPDRLVAATLQSDRTDFAMLRQWALRLGLDLRLDDGVLALTERTERSSRPVVELGLEEHRIEHLRLVRACEPASPTAVFAWDPLSRSLLTHGPQDATCTARVASLADAAEAEALARSLDAHRQDRDDELRLTLGDHVPVGPGDRFRLIDAPPIVAGAWTIASVRHEVGKAGIRMHLRSHPADTTE